MWKFAALAILLSADVVLAQAKIEGTKRVWHPLTITFQGPEASISGNSPNPFLDIRLQVRFASADGQTYSVPGYFDADGAAGTSGNLWRVHFTPDRPGKWSYTGAFRSGPGVAIQLEPEDGVAMNLPSLQGEFEVAPRDPDAPGVLKWGRLKYVGKHYLKFQDGPYWIRGGTDEPENLLAYEGFVRTPAKHKYADHLSDWNQGDPDWADGKGRAMIGALNYLAKEHVNSIYFMPMNIGGDGKDVWPFFGQINPKGDPSNDNLHYDVEKLRQWEIVFNHAQRLGIFLHLVFNEAEKANKRELDDGELGPERKLYYREMIARFAHHSAMQWNLCEEYNLDFDLTPQRVQQFADYIRAVDPYDHPVTVHTVGDPVDKMKFMYGDPRWSMTSIQLNQRPIHEVTEAIRNDSIKAGRPLPVSLDEFTLDRGQRASHLPVDDADGHRREKIWPTLMSGGIIEFILENLLKTDSFKTPEREKLWRYLWFARKFMEDELPFWEMDPADELAKDASTFPVPIGKGKTVDMGPQVFAKPSEVFVVYYPVSERTGRLDLSGLKGAATQQWYNPRTGEFVGEAKQIEGGTAREVGPPPADPKLDWVLLVRKGSPQKKAAIDRLRVQTVSLEKSSPSSPGKVTSIDTSAFRDSAGHWRHLRDENRIIHVEKDQPSYSPEQVSEIVDNILLFQRSNGGWPKDYDMLAILTDTQKNAIRSTHTTSDTSFDNHNIHSQVEYLAKAFTAFQKQEWKDACLRGFDFILNAQYPNGGFPQRSPKPKSYHAHITFNDGVMIGILNVLQDAAEQSPHWAWLDADRQQKAQQAVARGIDCILKCQIRVAGVRTGWCQQHDRQTLEAAPARTFELASICPQDTTEIVRFLMRTKSPDPQVVEATDAAVEWMKKVKLEGIRLERISAPAEEFLRHKVDYDMVIKQDPGAKTIWARHYEIGTDKPIFAGRDGIKRYSFAEMERERRTGTAWYGGWPSKLIGQEYPQWRESVAKR